MIIMQNLYTMKTIKLILLVFTIIFTGCKNKPVKSQIEEISGVRITQIQPETFSIPIHSTGMLVSSDEMKLSFKTGGIVAKIEFKEGDRVRKGDIIATLNLSEITAQVSLARSGYEKASRDFERAKNLYTDSVATLEQLQNATTALNLTKSNLDIALFNLTHSKITAPENGIILKQFVKQNELVSSGYPVFLFGTSGKNWKVKSGLSDRDIVRINKGDSAVIKFDAWPNVIFQAVVDQVGEMYNSMTGTYEIEMILKSTGYKMATGFIADILVFPSKKEAFNMVPVGAIVEADGQEGYIYSVTDSMTVKKNRIEIVSISGSKAAIKGILSGTKNIVSEGAAYLRDGQRVRVVK
jgi:multidrug efflux system membrane fusion protein